MHCLHQKLMGIAKVRLDSMGGCSLFKVWTGSRSCIACFLGVEKLSHSFSELVVCSCLAILRVVGSAWVSRKTTN